MIWNHGSRYWRYVRGNHCWPVDSPHKGLITPSFDVFFHVHLNKQLNKQLNWRWVDTPWRSCSVTVMWLNNWTRSRPETWKKWLPFCRRHWKKCTCVLIQISQKCLQKELLINKSAMLRIMVLKPVWGKWVSRPQRVNMCECIDLKQPSTCVRGLSYLGLIRSISWLLATWLLPSPGHQRPWYRLCRIGMSLSYLRNDSNNLCHIDVE